MKNENSFAIDMPANGELVRCAIYTRKSTDEGLSQEFNSLDAQRESAEAYIRSQRHEGWVALSPRYDDGGFTGGNMERPALKRLLADIEAGQIDCVVVYKVDRLSRSLLDFARIVQIFEKQRVSFVSVTQQFNTNTSMGRLTLNVLLSFAQFEREIISERTRDKMSAARRKGKWIGGIPMLGYDVDPAGGRLIINPEEAQQVRAMFELYLEYGSIMAVVQEANRRGWTTKQWTTKDGRRHAGKPLSKGFLFRMLTNVLYAGKVNHKGQVFDGEHAAIVPAEVWTKVDRRLRHNGLTGGRQVRNRYGALLRGVLWCEACQKPMVHTYSSKNGKRYRYYVCLTAQQQGWAACPSKSVSAQGIEDSVVQKIRAATANPEVTARAAEEVIVEAGKRGRELALEMAAAEKQLRSWNAEIARVSIPVANGGNAMRVARLAELQESVRVQEARLIEIRAELETLETAAIDEADVAETLRAFDPVWTALTSQEQVRMVAALVKRVTYDGRTGRVSLTFSDTGWRLLGRR